MIRASTRTRFATLGIDVETVLADAKQAAIWDAFAPHGEWSQAMALLVEKGVFRKELLYSDDSVSRGLRATLLHEANFQATNTDAANYDDLSEKDRRQCAQLLELFTAAEDHIGLEPARDRGNVIGFIREHSKICEDRVPHIPGIIKAVRQRGLDKEVFFQHSKPSEEITETHEAKHGGAKRKKQ